MAWEIDGEPWPYAKLRGKAASADALAKRVEELESLILDYCGRDTSALRIQAKARALPALKRRRCLMNALTKDLYPIGCRVKLVRGITRQDGEHFAAGDVFTVFDHDHRKDGFSLTPVKLEGFPRSLGLVNVDVANVERVHS